MVYEIPWYVILFESIPEILLIMKLGFKLFNIDLDTKKALFVSIIGGIWAYFVRKYILLFGIHTLVIIIFVVLLAWLILKIRLLYTFIALFMGVLILGVLQSTLSFLLLNITNININDLALNPWLNIVYFLPSALVMLIMLLIIKKKRFYLVDLNL